MITLGSSQESISSCGGFIREHLQSVRLSAYTLERFHKDMLNVHKLLNYPKSISGLVSHQSSTWGGFTNLIIEFLKLILLSYSLTTSGLFGDPSSTWARYYFTIDILFFLSRPNNFFCSVYPNTFKSVALRDWITDSRRRKRLSILFYRTNYDYLEDSYFSQTLWWDTAEGWLIFQCR